MRRPLLLLILVLLVPCCGRPNAAYNGSEGSITHETKVNGRKAEVGVADDSAAFLKPLIDPAKLATLGERGANTRVQKITAILWDAKQRGQDPAKGANDAVKLIGWGGTEKGRLTAAAMARNLTILERLGGTTPEDLDDMRHGRTATVRKGPYTGDILSVDHIIPRAVAPELDNVIANLELMPLSVNQKKNDKIGDRQISMAKAFHDAGLLSDAGYKRVMDARR